MQSASFTVTNKIFPISDKLFLHYSDYQPIAPSDGIPVVYLPGLMRTARDFDRVAVRLAGERRVITIDTRGRGKACQVDDAEAYNFDAMVEDVWKLLDDLQVKEFVIVALALGVFMSWQMAAQQPSRVRGIVTNDTGVETSAPIGKKMVGLADQDLHDFDAAVEKLRVPNQKNFMDMGIDDWRAYTRQVYAEVQPGKWKRDFHGEILPAWRAYRENKPDFLAELAGLTTTKVLVMRGAGSEFLKPEQIDRMRAALPSLKSIEVQGRAHPLLMDEPASLIGIRELLAEVDAG